jgi:hypothetical protein
MLFPRALLLDLLWSGQRTILQADRRMERMLRESFRHLLRNDSSLRDESFAEHCVALWTPCERYHVLDSSAGNQDERGRHHELKSHLYEGHDAGGHGEYDYGITGSQGAFRGLRDQSMFPLDNPKNTRFAINYFTSIGLLVLSLKKCVNI